MDSIISGRGKLNRWAYLTMGAITFGIWMLLLGLWQSNTAALGVAVAAAAAAVQLKYAHRAYDTAVAATRAYESSSIWLAAVAGGAVALLAERVLVAEVSTLSIAVAMFSTGLLHAVVQEIQAARQTVEPARQQRAVVIGTGEETAEWVALVHHHPEMGIDLAGCVGDRNNAARVGMEEHWLGPIEDLEEILEREQVELPIVAVTSFRRPALQNVINRLTKADYDIAMWWGVGRLSAARLSWRTMSHESMPMIRAQARSRVALAAKRVFDVAVSSFLLLLFSPILLVGVIAVRLDSQGPAFFRQRRVGLDARPFEMIKLRTMKQNAESELSALAAVNERDDILFKMEHDPRVTRVGTFLRSTSIDEIPQLFNVLRGEMSLVGPRPALVSENENFDDELAQRSSVRPGITGLWQLESRANPSFAAYKRLDLHYLENWSFGFDLRIAIATAQLLVLGAVVHPFVRRFSSRPQPTTAPAIVADSASSAEPQGLMSTPQESPGRQIAVLGAGYVGLTQALGLADLGHEVICADINEERVEALKEGKPPILEEGLDELLHNCLESGLLTFTSDPLAAVVRADFVFLCVPTPQGSDGSADLTYLDAAARQIGPVIQPHTIVINKSTVPVGSTVRVAKELNCSEDLVISNPEFLREGTAIADWKAPDRIVVGGNADAAQKVLDLYEELPGARIICDASSAELIKYASNAYLATRLTFVNSISEVCNAVGADVLEVTTAMGLDGRIGSRYLEPGPGWGGSCLPKDTHALAFQAEDAGVEFQQLRATIDANDSHIDSAAQLVIDTLPNGKGTVGVLGIAFKAGTGDIRDSPAIKVMDRLTAAGVTVRAFDPAVPELAASDVTVVNSSIDAARGADVLLIATEWPEFQNLDLEKVSEIMDHKQVVDLRNHLDVTALEPFGFEYQTIGSRKLVTTT